jgi:hypothetical protein
LSVAVDGSKSDNGKSTPWSAEEVLHGADAVTIALGVVAVIRRRLSVLRFEGREAG